MKFLRLLSTLAAGLTLASVSLGAAAQALQTLRIGASAGVHADALHAAVADARKAGLDVKVIEFTDWTTPNAALANGDIDLNYFQHQAFLDNAIKERGWKLQSAGVGILTNIGLYSYKVKRFEDLKEGARVGVASDQVNQGRGLLLLQQAGLIKLKDGVGTRGTVHDVVANPKKLKLVEVEGPQLVRAIDDLDLAQGYPGHFVNAGKPEVAGSALLFSGMGDHYFAIRFVTRADNVNNERIQRFIKLYQDSPAVREALLKSNANNPKLYTLAWLQQGK